MKPRPHEVHVSNVSWSASSADVHAAFTAAGFSVLSARLIADRTANRHRGFGFVQLNSASEVERAVRELDRVMVKGRALFVDAPPRPEGSS